MRLKGYDLFITDPNAESEMYCRVCQTRCAVQRNVYGPTSWGASMAHIARYHDVFECPHAEEDWHIQALKLVDQITNTPSKRLADLMRQDLQDLLNEHLPVAPTDLA
ncbi:MAG: hypothetical protein IT324_18305 [Anaerolineae bacterium]|nr:hypothetical protein [Anaerolineae bacterium]